MRNLFLLAAVVLAASITACVPASVPRGSPTIGRTLWGYLYAGSLTTPGAGMEVALYDDHGQQVATTRADGMGVYYFARLRPGRYVVGTAGEIAPGVVSDADTRLDVFLTAHHDRGGAPAAAAGTSSGEGGRASADAATFCAYEGDSFNGSTSSTTHVLALDTSLRWCVTNSSSFVGAQTTTQAGASLYHRSEPICGSFTLEGDEFVLTGPGGTSRLRISRRDPEGHVLALQGDGLVWSVDLCD